MVADVEKKLRKISLHHLKLLPTHTFTQFYVHKSNMGQMLTMPTSAETLYMCCLCHCKHVFQLYNYEFPWIALLLFFSRFNLSVLSLSLSLEIPWLSSIQQLV